MHVFSQDYAILTGSAQDTEVTKYQIKDCSFLSGIHSSKKKIEQMIWNQKTVDHLMRHY